MCNSAFATKGRLCRICLIYALYLHFLSSSRVMAPISCPHLSPFHSPVCTFLTTVPLRLPSPCWCLLTQSGTVMRLFLSRDH